MVSSMASLTLLVIGGVFGLLVFGIIIAAVVIWSQNRQIGEETSDQAAPERTPNLSVTPADLEAQVRQQVLAGKKIEAIKIYRQATGVGLKEAKDAVEAVERGQSLPAPVETSWDLASIAQPATPAQLEAELRQQVQQGNKLAAITLYRSATGVGLREAKDAIEALERGEPLVFPSLGTVASTAPNTPPADLKAQIANLMRQGRKIDAIKLYRQATNVGLAEAKEIVEAIERRQQ